MAIDGNLPLYIEGVGKVYHARQYRRLLEATFGAPGVLGIFDLLVGPSSPGAMSVDIGVGGVIVEATTGTDQGFYFVRNSTPLLDVPIDPSDPTDDRFDLVVMHILDAEHDGGVLNNNPDNPPYEIVKGAPDPSPADPTVPDNCEVLARVHVDAGASTITVVDDLRRFAPHEFQQKDTFTWAAHTTDFDVDTFVVPATPLHYAIIARPTLTIAWVPLDGVAWSVTFSVQTAASGGGTQLGKAGSKNPGTNAGRTLSLPCDEIRVAAGDQQTLYLHAAYVAGTPTNGFDSITIGERCARTLIRPTKF